MNIDISRIIAEKKECIDFNFDYALNDLELLQNYGIMEGGLINFSGKIFKRDKEIIVDAVFSGTPIFRCTRCLREFKKEIIEDVKFDIPVSGKEGDKENYLKNGYLNVIGILEDALAFSLPMKVLCSEECKGLCLICGQDLNINECDCDKNLIDPRLEKLKDFFSKNEEV